jgi:hypothetical protein
MARDLVRQQHPTNRPDEHGMGRASIKIVVEMHTPRIQGGMRKAYSGFPSASRPELPESIMFMILDRFE